MRVSFSMIYNQSVKGTNSRLADIVRLNEQISSQKKINRPSDDPEGMARTLDLTSTLSSLDQYSENIDTADGWLSLADEELGLASDVVTRLKELCEQASTGTYTDDERDSIVTEVKELMEELVSIANSEYAGDSIFAGSKTDTNAYSITLGSTVRDADGSSLEVQEIVGDSADSTIYVEFIDSGEIGLDEINYRYTTDGGDTWREETLAAGDTVLELGAAEVELVSGSTVTASSEEGEGDGTLLWIRPAALYQGNTYDSTSVVHYGTSAVTATAEGDFSTDVLVRVDSGDTLPGNIEYSYSIDGGSTWVSGNTTTDGSFRIPGGTLTLEPAGTALVTGDQFAVRSENAAIEVDIGDDSNIQINSVGKDIFGGLYVSSGSTVAEAALPEDENLFEVVGKMIGYMETNDLDGISKCLEDLGSAQEKLTTALGEIGGRENRLEFAATSIETIQTAATTNISNIEDADIVELNTALASAEYAYEAVLQSTSLIINLSLLDYM